MERGEVSNTMVSSPRDQLNMQEEKEVTLPDELVERILAMVPFPTVFKFRVLSKSWQARLSSISPQDGDEKRRLAISFRKQISHRSSNWKIFCPFSLSDNRENFIAFDRTSNTWLEIPLPYSLLLRIPWPTTGVHYKVRGMHIRVPHKCDLRMEGPLLLLPISRNELFMANILTQSWKQLPPCPHGTALGRILLSLKSEVYVVIVMPHQRDDHGFLQIYDSTSAAWSSIKIATSLNSSPFGDVDYLDPVAYLDGVLYLVSIPMNPYFVTSRLNPQITSHLKVLSIKVKEETEGLGFRVSAQNFNTVVELDVQGKAVAFVNPVICKTNLLIIVLYPSSNEGEEVQAVHIDLGTRKLLRVAMCPTLIGPSPGMDPVSDDDCIIARVNVRDGQVLTYNLKEDNWVLLHYSGLMDEAANSNLKVFDESIRSPFRPGLNPFADV